MMLARWTAGDGKDLVMIGVTTQEIVPLLQGVPITVDMAASGAGDLDMEGAPTVVFCRAISEEAIVETLKATGLIPPDAKPAHDGRNVHRAN